MKNSFDYLIEHYKHAKGIKNNDVYSKEFIKGFSHYLEQMNIMGNEFLNYLDFLNLDYKNSNCAEVGKGPHDTLVKPFDTKFLSLNTGELTDVDKSRFMIGNLRIYEGKACLLRGHKLEVIPKSVVGTYFVHNPYSFNSLYGITDIHNNDSANIILGVYGSNYDKDKVKKIERLEIFKENLVGDYISEYDTFDDAYYYILASGKAKIK